MSFRNYILRYAGQTLSGSFYCQLCEAWIAHQRWPHFKKLHRYASKPKSLNSSSTLYEYV